MSYLEEEIDDAFRSLEISSRKLQTYETTALINNLTKKFFTFESSFLDPVELNEKNSEHNPNFWKEIQYRINQKDLILLVLDSTYSGWEIDNAQDIASILGETTGYPFWVTDSKLTFLVHMDDHDCVIWA
ncbi:hypothetical protein [Pseudomonas grimontii]|jgi:hypothetical protein|uniref:Uncharacterized protein n=1 Tax=Pseudomonas grimontii TaxID=129847 RepID=A0A1H1IEZ6_9PSED|nr:hypothetical protein [Pseudomonas grimontii]TWR54032.1 hypothetical protein FIV39_31020 [Pseudomonas grimontii]SDR36251.1 hypothetical protein SAMN04490186_5606 [Pseudomonas grimontii]